MSLRVGVAGLGWAGGLILHSLAGLQDVEIVAAAAPREKFRVEFECRFGGRAYDDIDGLAADPDVDAIWISTPSHLHCRHAVLAARNGKHIVVDKPFAVTLAECEEMISAAAESDVALIAGGVRSLEPAIVDMRRVVTSGRIGQLTALNAWSYTGWMAFPRDPLEVDPSSGGGMIHNQAPHQLDAIRYLGGGMIRSVYAVTGRWMEERACAGYYSAILAFEDGTTATLSYDGHGYVLGWELVPWGETDERVRARDALYDFRRRLRSEKADEHDLRESLRFGQGGSSLVAIGDGSWTPADAGLIVAACERGAVRQSRTGLFVYDHDGRHDKRLDDGVSLRSNELAELRAGIENRSAPTRDGAWGMATLEAVLAIISSAERHAPVQLSRQTPVKETK